MSRSQAGRCAARARAFHHVTKRRPAWKPLFGPTRERLSARRLPDPAGAPLPPPPMPVAVVSAAGAGWARGARWIRQQISNFPNPSIGRCRVQTHETLERRRPTFRPARPPGSLAGERGETSTNHGSKYTHTHIHLAARVPPESAGRVWRRALFALGARRRRRRRLVMTQRTAPNANRLLRRRRRRWGSQSKVK